MTSKTEAEVFMNENILKPTLTVTPKKYPEKEKLMKIHPRHIFRRGEFTGRKTLFRYFTNIFFNVSIFINIFHTINILNFLSTVSDQSFHVLTGFA